MVLTDDQATRNVIKLVKNKSEEYCLVQKSDFTSYQTSGIYGNKLSSNYRDFWLKRKALSIVGENTLSYFIISQCATMSSNFIHAVLSSHLILSLSNKRVLIAKEGSLFC